MVTGRCKPTDRISNLPSHLIETILMLLPLRGAARTSILSKKWRYNWTNIPQLVFDDTLIQDSKENELSLQRRLFMAIYQVLLLHDGPILKFSLCTSQLASSYEIDQFILFLSRKSVMGFSFGISKDQQYTLPSSFFSCSQLRHLKLSNCEFVPPLTFNGFSSLVQEFAQVSIGRYVGNLVSSCPLLEKVTLAGSTHFECIEIDAPNLKYLNLGYRFVAFLTVAGVPERLPFTLDHLQNLELWELCFGEIAELAFALCLLKSSPNLEYFQIRLLSNKNDAIPPVLELLEMQDHSDVAFNQLREAAMRFVSGTRPELEFIKLILAKSPLLETMLIVSDSAQVADNGVGILSESQSALQPTVQVKEKPAQKRLKIIKGFSQLMPVMFEGGTDPMIADDYMEQVETQLISMDVTKDHLKIILATYKFAKDA
ncbi:F-box/FBD/LRR-repeat protein At1g13570-like [Cornus florida]|uniref:F-box/FBD/LRR-repeat protein At1g13570-like n=1 Tax=Cornus florida TaxID=4283 RepID=UPI0028965AC5|nr:F-box/FBD/LRR-repeat protein At1g13570-like [Cornus florida]